MAPALQVGAQVLKIVEFTVYRDMQCTGGVGNGLVAGSRVHNAQAHMPQGDTGIRRQPHTLVVGPAVLHNLQTFVEVTLVNLFVSSKKRQNSTHLPFLK